MPHESESRLQVLVFIFKSELFPSCFYPLPFIVLLLCVDVHRPDSSSNYTKIHVMQRRYSAVVLERSLKGDRVIQHDLRHCRHVVSVGLNQRHEIREASIPLHTDGVMITLLLFHLACLSTKRNVDLHAAKIAPCNNNVQILMKEEKFYIFLRVFFSLYLLFGDSEEASETVKLHKESSLEPTVDKQRP